MRMNFVWLGVAVTTLVLNGGAAPADNTVPRQPVLLELFTSEGCSSCPPADALLEKLDREQPIGGAQIIVLSEHVDYWNQQGWSDPYSSHAITTRQENYVRRFGLTGPYTPEMVVDGAAEFAGNNARKVESAIRQSMQQPKVGIRIQAAASGDAAVTIEVDPLPSGAAKRANVYLARAADHGSSNVLRGENQGRRLTHVSIVADIQQVGSIGAQGIFKKDIQIRAKHTPAGSRLVAFVQENGNGRVWGAAMYAVANGEKP